MALTPRLVSGSSAKRPGPSGINAMLLVHKNSTGQPWHKAGHDDEREKRKRRSGDGDMSVEQRLKELGITLPPTGGPLGNYVPAKRAGDLLYLSGNGPLRTDGSMPKGKLGAGVSGDGGYRHAR